MNASDDYCDLCDLPKSQCVHGRPPPEPKPAVKAPAKKRPVTTTRTAPDRKVARRWTPPEVFKPLIVSVLEQAGGELATDDLFLELEILAEGHLLPGDTELTPEGELRWRYAVRRARMALVTDGLMKKDKPGFWQLA